MVVAKTFTVVLAITYISGALGERRVHSNLGHQHLGVELLDNSQSAETGLYSTVQGLLFHIPWSPLSYWSPFAMGRQLLDQNKSKDQNRTLAEGIVPSAKGEEPLPWIFAVAGGTGASIGDTGSAIGARDLLRRIHCQDKAVALLVMMFYVAGLFLSASISYRQALNNSPVTYYADPRFHNLAIEGHDLDTFLDTFNQPPKNITLQVTGFAPGVEMPSDSGLWVRERFEVAFTFSLDLSMWVERELQSTSTEGSQQGRPLQLHDGMLPGDRSILNHHLTHDQNDLSRVELVKEVAWPGWEELATNIKHQIRQNGFNGVIVVNRGERDKVHVYKNRPWANFMHSRSTRALSVLSILGNFMYAPYMWLRCKKVCVRSYYRIDVDISEYWHLIADKLSASGFDQEDLQAAPTNA